MNRGLQTLLFTLSLAFDTVIVRNSIAQSGLSTDSVVPDVSISALLLREVVEYSKRHASF